MRYGIMLLLVVVAVCPTNAFASCPTVGGPYTTGSLGWYTYDFDTSCASTSGNVYSTSMWCYSSPAYQWYSSGSGSVDYEMTVPIDANPYFSVSMFVEFSDPHSSSSNAVSASVVCRHNNSVTHSETIFIHQGNQGSMSCVRVDSSTFTASPGDVITVSMGGQNYNSDTTMQISTPTIFSTTR